MADAPVHEAKNAYLDRETYHLNGRIVLITGASAGCGKETARDLALRGATIIMANRNLEKSRSVIDTFREEEGYDKLPEERFVVKRLDLADLESVKQFAEEVKKEFPVIDILINNAGMYDNVRQVTKDGYEAIFQTNHLGHFLLTYLLIENLLRSPNSPRIINVSSLGHKLASEKFLDDLQSEAYKWDGFLSYCNTKLMNVLFTKKLAQMYLGKIRTYALHPGAVRTEIDRDSKLVQRIAKCMGFFGLLKTEKEGALTTIYCAVSRKAGQETGLYYADSCVKEPSKVAKNMDLREQLWKVSCELLDIQWD